MGDLENANLALNQKIADMKQEMEDLKSSFRSQLASKDDEIKRLLDELANQVSDFLPKPPSPSLPSANQHGTSILETLL